MPHSSFDFEAPLILSDSDDSFAEFDLRSELAQWAVEYKISHTALSNLLQLLRNAHPELPKDPRTSTSTNYTTSELAGGSYYHFDLVQGVPSQLKKFHYLTELSTISIQINIDGLPLFKSSKGQFWPILGLIEYERFGFVHKEPFTIGLFNGMSKPNCISSYLHNFINEVKLLEESGLTFKDVTYPFKLSAGICNAPAHAFVKQIKGHSGYYGCYKCTQRGEYVGKVVFPENGLTLRTDTSFKDMSDKNHHIAPSPLCTINLGMVSQFPLDYMHLVCLGVMRKMVHLWRRGPLKTRLGYRAVEDISSKPVALRPYIPCEFSRKPRSLKESDYWKATEFRQFLLYTGALCLRSQLPAPLFEHFLTFSVAVHILANKELLPYTNYANGLLHYFVDNFSTLYGKEFLTYNVHGLLHLAVDVESFGKLDHFSSFPFENFLGKLKKLVRNAVSPLQQQIIRRSSEPEANGCFNKKLREIVNVQKRHFNGPTVAQ